MNPTRPPRHATFVGTSGWQYRHWRGVFYPSGLRTDRWLDHYVSEFPAVEVNSSFYRLPTPETVARWRERAGGDFRFAVTAPRRITHYKKLKGCESVLAEFLNRVQALGDRLGPLLFRLPPRWRCNARRLEAFLRILRPGLRYAFELRDPSWHCGEVFDLLRAHGAAHCIFDVGGETSPMELTADFGYVRLHGPAGRHGGSYPSHVLRGWVSRAAGWNRAGKQVFVFFDNDERAFSVKNARRVRRYLEEDV